MLFSAKQLQKKFKHAKYFGITGNYSLANAAKFRSALENHINAPTTEVIQGEYRRQPVIFFVNRHTRLIVIQDASGYFLSGWRLSGVQLNRVVNPPHRLGGN
jgi:hypothetical protein